jgi:hypothetical protein
MKSIKFLLFFNLFFYAGILFTISVGSLLIYNIGFDSYKTLLINFHTILPFIFLAINVFLFIILTVRSFLKWSNLYIDFLITARKKRSDFISVERISFSN